MGRCKGAGAACNHQGVDRLIEARQPLRQKSETCRCGDGDRLRDHPHNIRRRLIIQRRPFVRRGKNLQRACHIKHRHIRESHDLDDTDAWLNPRTLSRYVLRVQPRAIDPMTAR